MSGKVHPLYSETSPSNEMSTKRKSESNVNPPSTTNQSISVESSEDLDRPVSTEKGVLNCDPKSPPAKKRRESDNSNDTHKPPVRTRWRIWEKQCLTEAFKEYTKEKDIWLDNKPPDLELCEWILSKFPEDSDVTPENIQTFLNNALKKEHQRRFCNDYPIDKWIEVIDAASPEDNNVAKQLELIMTVAKQEPSDGVNLPSFDESLPQPDYEAIYDYLSKVFTDKPLPELSPIDSLVVEDLMQSLVFQVESLNDGELRKSLRQVYLHFAQEPDEEQENDHEELRRSLLHSITVLNPLGLNAQSIVPVPPK